MVTLINSELLSVFDAHFDEILLGNFVFPFFSSVSVLTFKERAHPKINEL